MKMAAVLQFPVAEDRALLQVKKENDWLVPTSHEKQLLSQTTPSGFVGILAS